MRRIQEIDRNIAGTFGGSKRQKLSLKSCLKSATTPRSTGKRVTYNENTSFMPRPEPTSRSERALEKAAMTAVDEEQYMRMRDEIIAKSPMFPKPVSPSAPSSSDQYEPHRYSPPVQLALQLYPIRPIDYKKKGRKHLDDLETRIKELEQDRVALLSAYEQASEWLQQEHFIRKQAEAKAENLGLNYRIAKAKLHSCNGQMELFASKMRCEMEKAWSAANSTSSPQSQQTLKVHNPDFRLLDESFDSVSSL